MGILLEIKNLSIEYKSIKDGEKNSVTAVKNVSMKINKGEIYALAGESGCGKSTLAKAITKLVPIKSGDILFEEGSDLFCLDFIHNRFSVLDAISVGNMCCHLHHQPFR